MPRPRQKPVLSLATATSRILYKLQPGQPVVPSGAFPGAQIPVTTLDSAGNQNPATTSVLPFGGGIAAFKEFAPPPYGQNPGPNPNIQPFPWIKKFRYPLALFNDASQWVNVLQFTRPLPFEMAPDSNPPPLQPYMRSRPYDNLPGLASGFLNLTQQLGNLSIQGMQLTNEASNYSG